MATALPAAVVTAVLRRVAAIRLRVVAATGVRRAAVLLRAASAVRLRAAAASAVLRKAAASARRAAAASAVLREAAASARRAASLLRGGPMMPGAGGDVNTTLPLILNIATALLCSGACVSFILSVLGIVFAVQASTAKNAGDVETARAKAKTSMLMAIISAVLGLIAGVVITILRVLNS